LSESLSNKQLIKYSLLILLLGITIGSVSLTYPFGRDQGIYAYAGKLLLEGKIQYRYVFDLKPPGVHYTFALAEMIFGDSMFSVRIFDIFWQSLTALVIFLITFHFSKSKSAGIFSSFLYIFLYYRLDYWHTLQADGFLNLPFAYCVLLLITSSADETEPKMIIAGIFFALTVLFKYTVLVFLGFLLLWLFIGINRNLKVRFKNYMFFLIGFVFSLMLIMGIYYLTDSLHQFIDVQFVQIPLYAGIGFDTESFSFIVRNIIHMLFSSVYSPLILSCFILFFIFIRGKKFTADRMLLFIWIISEIINLVVQWKFFHYHFLVIIPPIVVGTSITCSYLFELYHEKYPKILNISFITILIFYLIFASKPYISNYQKLFEYAGGRKSLKQLYIETGVTSDSAFMISNTYKAVDYVTQNTKNSDKIFIWGFDPVVYYLSGRECASKFIYNFPLYWKGNNNTFRKEFLEELNSNNPELILVSQKDPLFYISGYNEDSKQMLLRFPEFKKFMDEKYNLKTQIDNFFYYELKRDL